MITVLVPCDGSHNALLGIHHVVDQVRSGRELRIHLVNVQPPFHQHVGRYFDHEVLSSFHRAQAEDALAAARQLLDSQEVPYTVHFKVGDKVACISEMALQLRCDLILIGTSRKSSLLRAVGNSLTTRLIECSQVPVEVIAGTPPSTAERVGIPAGIGAGLALLWMGAAA